MKIALLKIDDSINIGDNIQTLAVAQHVGQPYEYIDRNNLNEYDGEPCVVVFNAWFSNKDENWPPSDKIIPIFHGFHMTPTTAKAYEKHKAYFKKHAPIGCRDQGTADIIKSWGIESYVTGCATMTLPRRKTTPANGRNVLVDVNRSEFKNYDDYHFIVITHVCNNWRYHSNDLKIRTAQELLNYYRDQAKCVVTSRIHCAMPCLAMGIPVFYTGVDEYRTRIVDLIGMPRLQFHRSRIPKFGSKPVDFDSLNFEAPDYRDKKIELASHLRDKLKQAGVQLAPWEP